MGLVKSEYRAGVYDAQHFKDHTLDGDERRQREQAAAQQVLLQAIRARRTVFGRTLRDPRAVFQAIDRDGSGKVSPDELANGLQRLGLGLSLVSMASGGDLKMIQYKMKAKYLTKRFNLANNNGGHWRNSCHFPRPRSLKFAIWKITMQMIII